MDTFFPFLYSFLVVLLTFIQKAMERGCLVLCILFLLIRPAFSEIISFSAFTKGYWQIWKMDIKTGELQQVTKSPRDKKEAAWFNNGHSFIYRTANAGFYQFDINTGEDMEILKKFGNIFDPALSPDNKKLVFTRFKPDIADNSALWLFDFDLNKARKLTHAPKLQYDPVWSADNKKIAFVSSEGTGHNIKIMTTEKANISILTANKAYNISPDWSSDGSKIVFASNITGDFEIWKMDSNGGNQKRLTHSKGLDTQPVWFPDTRKIAFVSNRQGNMQIWMMDADGNGQSSLTPQGLRCSDPVFIPEQKMNDN